VAPWPEPPRHFGSTRGVRGGNLLFSKWKKIKIKKVLLLRSKYEQTEQT
jgi:hypothetical protein